MVDEVTDLQRSARHRLIGAVAFTTFVVVLLPLIFDRVPPPALNPDIPVKIAGQPEPIPAPPEDPVIQPPLLGDPASSVAASALEMDATLAASNPLPQSAISGEAHSSAAEQNPPVSSNFGLQTGAYTSESTAHQQASKLNTLGYNAFVEHKANTWRVRIKGFADRHAADEARKKLLKQGFHANLVPLS